MNFKEFFKSDKTAKILWGIGILILIFAAFGAGTFFGYRKAIFSSRSGENYYRNFYGGRGGFFGMFMDRDNMMNSHGTVGTVMDVSSSTVAIKDRSNNERSVAVSEDTVIRSGRVTINLSALQIGETVAVIGAPNGQGQIEARFIRVFSSSSGLFVPLSGAPLPPMRQFGSSSSQ